MTNFKPGRKTQPIPRNLKLMLISHMKTHSISIPVLASSIGISKHILYNVLTGRSGCTEGNRKKIQSYMVGV